MGSVPCKERRIEQVKVFAVPVYPFAQPISQVSLVVKLAQELLTLSWEPAGIPWSQVFGSHVGSDPVKLPVGKHSYV